jgi:hypothetical protein
MQTPQVMKEMSAPAMRVEPTNMAVQFCETQKPEAWQQMLTGPQQHDWLVPVYPLFWPQQHATFPDVPGAYIDGGTLCATSQDVICKRK